ncbi:MAG: sensor histidine kinase KdpD [Candidatus Omnitrophota bacterium]
METKRPDPDALLASLKREEARQKRGKLRIFLGMCPGVGKTYAMLQAARQKEAEGIDVLIGVAETHGRKETQALLEGMTVASKIKIEYRGTLLEEMDLDTVFMIRPQLVVVDELAHTNVPGSRHPKRYQDVLELLAAGIDVYTTLNVQHVESRSEAVYQITRVKVRETVPDSIVDGADEITLIDLSPEQLRQRLDDGKVYLGERAVTAADNFFREENLTALREMALRLTAERVNQDLRVIMSEQKIEGPWKTGDRLMVAVGATPFSESLIRWTRLAAASLNASWLAVYVETADTLDEDEKKRLTQNLTLARQLGAEVILKSGSDVAGTLLEVARQNNVSQICVGKPSGNPFWEWFRMGSVIRQLIHQSGDIDIHMVRVKNLGKEKTKPRRRHYVAAKPRDFLISLLIAAAVTVACFFVEKFGGYSSVALIYLLAVVLSGMILSRWPVLLLAGLSALLWNYLFIPPRFTFQINKSYDAMMFVMFFVTALVMGHITTRLREREQAERKQEDRLNTLYQLTRIIAMTRESKEAIKNALEKLEEVLKVRGAIFLANPHGNPDFEKSSCGDLVLSGKEKSVATWAFQKRQVAGRFTETLPEAGNFCFPLVSMNKSLGVLVIHPLQDRVWTLDQRSLVDSFASLMAVILEKDVLTKMAEEAKVKAETEKLQTALLDSVSHELKTPLTVISGSVEHLEKAGKDAEFPKLVLEIRTASRRLLQTVNGLLNMTRLDSGSWQLDLDWHDIRDVVGSALEHLEEPLSHHKFVTRYADILPPVRIDAGILRQALTNILSNAAAYSMRGTEIIISAHIDEKTLVMSVIDQGPGIAEEDADRIFEKFYRGKNVPTGGLGLGLSIARRFVEVHGGEIGAYNQKDGGACFEIRLPVELFREEKGGMS